MPLKVEIAVDPYLSKHNSHMRLMKQENDKINEANQVLIQTARKSDAAEFIFYKEYQRMEVLRKSYKCVEEAVKNVANLNSANREAIPDLLNALNKFASDRDEFLQVNRIYF